MRRLQETKRSACVIAVLIALLPFSLIAAEPPVAHVHNFGKVDDRLYRGAEPSLVGLQELGAMGIKMVIDLREKSEATEFERQQVEKLKMKYVNIPLAAFSAPTPDQVQRVLALLLHTEPDPVFVHCRRGKDRTGTIVACYRIQHDRWDNEKAFAEAKKYGMSFAERGMRSYILNFSPVVIPDVEKAQSQPAVAGVSTVPARP